MAIQIYNPYIINSSVCTVYCSLDEFNNNHEIREYLDIIPDDFPIISNVEISNLVYLKFDDSKKLWKIYHANNNEDFRLELNNAFYFINTLLLNKRRYFGVLINHNLKIIKCILPSGEVKVCNKKDVIDQDNFKNILIPTTTGGVVHINSTSFNDLIFSTFKFSNCENETYNILNKLVSPGYYQNLKSAIQDFEEKFRRIKSLNPIIHYSEIYNYFRKFDTEFFNNKMGQFQNEIMEMFKEFDHVFGENSNPYKQAYFIANFINNLKKDLCIELNLVYYRLRDFPKQRTEIYHKYRKHPYIKLLKIIHQRFLDGNKRRYVCFNEIYQMFSDDNLVVYDKLTTITKNAIASRSQLFCFAYQQFLDSKYIKRKYRAKYDYFPFKIFSSRMFIMEHMSD